MANTTDENTELLVRRILSEEIKAYREFLERQTKLVFWSFGAILAAAIGVGTFLLGKSYSDIESRMERMVDQKVIEYRIDENLKNRLNERVLAILDQPKVATKISEEVEHQVSNYVSKETDKIIAEKISYELKRIKADELEKLLNDSVTKTNRQFEELSKLKVQVNLIEDSLGLKKGGGSLSFDKSSGGPVPRTVPGTVPGTVPPLKP